MIITRTEQAVKIDPGNTTQRQDDGVRGENTADRSSKVAVEFLGWRQGVKVANVELVGDLLTGIGTAVGDRSPAFFNTGDDGLKLYFAEDAPRRIQANPVVRREEVEESCAGRRRFESSRPIGQVSRIMVQEGVKNERRQRELIYKVRLVPLSEVGDVICMRHIGFADQESPRGECIEDHTQQLDDPVGLRKVNATCPNLLP